MASSGAAASEQHVEAAAIEALVRGNAVDAVVAGIAAAAAESAAVLLGPVQVLVGGGGTGLLAFDGRARQPGRGVRRPRGFLKDAPVPATALVATPALPATLAALAGSLGSTSLARLVGAVLADARARSPERAAVLEAFAHRGAPVFVDGSIARELVASAGRAVSGLLTEDDLDAVRPEVIRCAEESLGPEGIVRAPWGAPRDASSASTHIVAAADARGMMAVACYERPDDGVPIPALGLVAPRAAAPVMRGEVRAPPGAPRPAASPIALRMAHGIVDFAIGMAGPDSFDVAVLAHAVTVSSASSLVAIPDTRLVAVQRVGDRVRVVGPRLSPPAP